MKIATVSPINHHGKDNLYGLTYFMKQHASSGSLVEITVNKKKLSAVLIHTEPVSSQKIVLKKGLFRLKKIDKVLADPPPFNKLLLPIAQELSNFYREAIGPIMKLFIPSPILTSTNSHVDLTPKKRELEYYQPEVVIGTLAERIHYYKTLVREAHAKNKTVVIITPTVLLAEYISLACMDLPNKPIVIHGDITKKDFQSQHERFSGPQKSKLIIATPIALGLLHGNEDFIIVEDADSIHYRRPRRPFFPITEAIKMFARVIQTRYIEGKYFPALTDLQNDTKLFYISSRLKNASPITLAGIASDQKNVLCEDIQRLLITDTRPTILLTTRKGFYTFIYCCDCGTNIVCNTCHTPLVLYQGKQAYYWCRRCGKKTSANAECEHCGGWNLRGYGTGTQRIFAEVKKIAPDRPCWIYDADTVTTQKKREAVKNDFLQSESGILIGTDMILEEPTLRAHHGVIVNMDNLFSIPEYHVNERALTFILKLAEKITGGPSIIQTRFPNHPLFQHLLQQKVKSFLALELEERRKTHLPPYTLFIKITISHKNKNEREARISRAEKLITSYIENISSYDSFLDSTKHHILISISKDNWHTQSENLKHLLDAHSREWDIVVDPESVL